MPFFLIAFFIFQDLPTCESINTEIGVITCRHCGPFPNAIYVSGFDIAIRKREDKKFCHQVSGEEPCYFYDRRGTRHKLKTNGRTENYWRTHAVFFSGESGSGVYDKNDRVCGIVLGNVKIGRRWFGRVLRFDAVFSTIDRVPPEFRPEGYEEFRMASDDRSTPEPSENEEAFPRQNALPSPKEPEVFHGTFSN